MSISIPITWQMVVNTHDGALHLFRYVDTLPIMPTVGLLLSNVDGIPDVAGPEVYFDNVIARVLYDGCTKRVICQLQGVRAATQTLEEVMVDLAKKNTGWKYVTQLPNGAQEETKPPSPG